MDAIVATAISAALEILVLILRKQAGEDISAERINAAETKADKMLEKLRNAAPTPPAP